MLRCCPGVNDVPVLVCACGKRLRAPGAKPGRVGRCPSCGGTMRVPEVLAATLPLPKQRQGEGFEVEPPPPPQIADEGPTAGGYLVPEDGTPARIAGPGRT